jgi:3-oxoacyl-[acyl-carrier-protein] synthase II
VNARIVGHAWRVPREIVANPFSPSYRLARVAAIAQPPARSRNERFLRRMGLYGMEVAHEAFAAAKLAAGPRYGMFVGVGGLRAHWDDMLAALADQDDAGSDAWKRGLENVHPYWMLRHLSNNVHALASAELGLRGEGATFGGADGGLHAIRSAARALADGAVDAALVVAYDSLLEPETLVELGERMPTDFVPGEAAAAIVLVPDAGRTLALAPLGRITPVMGHLGAATAVVQTILEIS